MIGSRSLTGVRMNQSATLLHQGQTNPETDIDLSKYGDWVENQDPLTGEIVRVWKPFEDTPDDPVTPDYDPDLNVIPCMARAQVSGGIKTAGTTEVFNATYTNVDYVNLYVPSWVKITKRDRVTNITDAHGHIIWLDEEYYNPSGNLPPVATVFNVNGVTPLLNPFNRVTNKLVILERAESYDGSAQE